MLKLTSFLIMFLLISCVPSKKYEELEINYNLQEKTLHRIGKENDSLQNEVDKLKFELDKK